MQTAIRLMFDPFLIEAFNTRYGEGAFGRFMLILVSGTIVTTAVVIAFGVNGYL